MSTLPFQGGSFSGFGTYANVDRQGHFTLKQLRLHVLNEAHTNSYTGPRLTNVFINIVLFTEMNWLGGWLPHPFSLE